LSRIAARTLIFASPLLFIRQLTVRSGLIIGDKELNNSTSSPVTRDIYKCTKQQFIHLLTAKCVLFCIYR